MNAVGLWLVKTQTVGTGVPSVVVTGAFSADYENYRVTWTGGALAGAAALTFQLGPSSVSGYNTTYYGGLSRVTNAGVFVGLGTNNAGTWNFAGFGDTDGAIIDMDVLQPNVSTRYTHSKYAWHDNRATESWGVGYGVHRVKAAFTDFTISAGSNLTGGTIRVYGYKN
jgi:hypothetical protein